MSNELLVSRLAGRVAIALREEGEVVEIRVEERGDDPAFGDVFKGRVTRILPGLQAAFVDLGAGPDAFLHPGQLLQLDQFAALAADREPAHVGGGGAFIGRNQNVPEEL